MSLSQFAELSTYSVCFFIGNLEIYYLILAYIWFWAEKGFNVLIHNVELKGYFFRGNLSF